MQRQNLEIFTKITRFHLDKAKKYKSYKFINQFKELDININYSSPYSHKQNGEAE